MRQRPNYVVCLGRKNDTPPAKLVAIIIITGGKAGKDTVRSYTLPLGLACLSLPASIPAFLQALSIATAAETVCMRLLRLGSAGVSFGFRCVQDA